MTTRVDGFARHVYLVARNIGLAEPQARLAAAQASLETGYGKSVKGNNFFGIKTGKSWSGPTQNVRTWEEVGGQKVVLTDKFRKYESLEESLEDWADTVARRWPDAMSATSFEEAARGLRYGKRGGYATDSHYGEKLAYVERRIGETYTPPSEELMNFAQKTEADEDRRKLRAGEPLKSLPPTIFDMQKVANTNTLATPIPRNKPETAPLKEPTLARTARQSDEDQVTVPLPQSKPMGNRNYRDANSDHSSNPFSLSNTNLDQQVKLLERNPWWAKHMIMAAGRDPRFFGL